MDKYLETMKEAVITLDACLYELRLTAKLYGYNLQEFFDKLDTMDELCTSIEYDILHHAKELSMHKYLENLYYKEEEQRELDELFGDKNDLD